MKKIQEFSSFENDPEPHHKPSAYEPEEHERGVLVKDEAVWMLLENMIKLLKTKNTYNDHAYLANVAQVSESRFGFPLGRLSAFINDGTDSIFVTFDDGNSFSSDAIEVKQNEKITDFPRHCETLVVRAKSGTQPFRVYGVR